MEIYKDYFKRFGLNRIVFQFTDAELQEAVFTEEEKNIFERQIRNVNDRLELAQIIARGIDRGKINNNKKEKSWLK